MSAAPDLEDNQVFTLNQTAESKFDPRPYFVQWLQALARFRNRTELSPGVFLEDDHAELSTAVGSDCQLPEPVYSDGTLVVTEEGKLQADVEVNVALIDGHFKGRIKASEQVVLENHAMVIGNINTPALTIRGGAIVEGRCYFAPSEQIEGPIERGERPGWQAFKMGFAKVWRGRIFQ